jgi:hypothetical protein
VLGIDRRKSLAVTKRGGKSSLGLELAFGGKPEI